MRLIDADAFLKRNEELADCDFYHPKFGGTLQDIVDMEPTVGGWVSVKDRLPETRHAVLVYTPHHKNIWAAVMHEDGFWYIWSPGGRVLLDPDWYGPITHWMTLPEPPKGEN